MKYFYILSTLVFVTLLLNSCGRWENRVGPAGPKGDTGAVGATGSNGHSVLSGILNTSACSNGGYTLLVATDNNDNGSIDLGDSIASAEICNGLNGATGANGQDAVPSPFQPVGLVDPCGHNPGIHNEVFLRLANNTLVASFSDNINGYNTRFSVLTPGSYVTTDGDSCSFSVDANNAIVNENHTF